MCPLCRPALGQASDPQTPPLPPCSFARLSRFVRSLTLIRPQSAAANLPTLPSSSTFRCVLIAAEISRRVGMRRAMLDHHRKTYNKFENRRIKCWLFERSTNYGGERELINLVISVRGMKLLNSAKDESFLHLSKIE